MLVGSKDAAPFHPHLCLDYCLGGFIFFDERNGERTKRQGVKPKNDSSKMREMIEGEGEREDEKWMRERE
jgi:hypothetical protein